MKINFFIIVIKATICQLHIVSFCLLANNYDTNSPIRGILNIYSYRQVDIDKRNSNISKVCIEPINIGT